MYLRKCLQYPLPSPPQGPTDPQAFTMFTNLHLRAIPACQQTASPGFYIPQAPHPAVRRQVRSPSYSLLSQQTTTVIYSISTPFLHPPTPPRYKPLSKPPVAPSLLATSLNLVSLPVKSNQPPPLLHPCQNILVPRPSSLLVNPVRPASLLHS